MGNHEFCEECGENSFHNHRDCDPDKKAEFQKRMAPKPKLKSLQEIQKEIGQWSRELFKDNESKYSGQRLYSQNSLTGATEELGELLEATEADGEADAHSIEVFKALARIHKATICRHQGRRGYDRPEKYNKDRNDAVADILVFLCDYAEREDFSLLEELNKAWDIVKQRTMKNWEKIGHDQPPSSMVVVRETEHSVLSINPDVVDSECKDLPKVYTREYLEYVPKSLKEALKMMEHNPLKTCDVIKAGRVCSKCSARLAPLINYALSRGWEIRSGGLLRPEDPNEWDCRYHVVNYRGQVIQVSETIVQEIEETPTALPISDIVDPPIEGGYSGEPVVVPSVIGIQTISYHGELHLWKDEDLRELADIANKKGWQIKDGNGIDVGRYYQLYLPGDVSDNWETRFSKILVNGKAIIVPGYLQFRMNQLGQLKGTRFEEPAYQEYVARREGADPDRLVQNGHGQAEPLDDLDDLEKLPKRISADITGWRPLIGMVCKECGTPAGIHPNDQLVLGCSSCKVLGYKDETSMFITLGEYNRRFVSAAIPPLGSRFPYSEEEPDDKYSLAREIADTWLDGQVKNQAIRLINNRRKSDAAKKALESVEERKE